LISRQMFQGVWNHTLYSKYGTLMCGIIFSSDS
jgi:hypothetical protein